MEFPMHLNEGDNQDLVFNLQIPILDPPDDGALWALHLLHFTVGYSVLSTFFNRSYIFLTRLSPINCAADLLSYVLTVVWYGVTRASPLDGLRVLARTGPCPTHEPGWVDLCWLIPAVWVWIYCVYSVFDWTENRFVHVVALVQATAYLCSEALVVCHTPESEAPTTKKKSAKGKQPTPAEQWRLRKEEAIPAIWIQFATNQLAILAGLTLALASGHFFSDFALISTAYPQARIHATRFGLYNAFAGLARGQADRKPLQTFVWAAAAVAYGLSFWAGMHVEACAEKELPIPVWATKVNAIYLGI